MRPTLLAQIAIGSRVGRDASASLLAPGGSRGLTVAGRGASDRTHACLQVSRVEIIEPATPPLLTLPGEQAQDVRVRRADGGSHDQFGGSARRELREACAVREAMERAREGDVAL